MTDSLDEVGRRRRVPALAPDDRRAALIAATIPLLHQHGIEVSTRQIAAAAGVAEGTIFGVFDSKNSLVVCSVIKALDPQELIDKLDAIDRSSPLHDRLAEAGELLRTRFAESATLMNAARKLIFAAQHVDQGAQDQMAANRERVHAALVAVIEPDAHQLRRSPAAVASLLTLFCGATTFGPFGNLDGLRGADLASLLLDGLLQRGAE